LFLYKLFMWRAGR